MTEREERTPCAGCGLVIAGGEAGCLALYQTLFAQTGSIPTYEGIGRLAFDTYCVQHPDVYCISAKSLAAHLGGVCWGVEHGGGTWGYERLRRSLDGPVRFPKPPLPAYRGALTIADIAAATDAARLAAIQAWARDAWGAYAELHGWARERVAMAVGAGG